MIIAPSAYDKDLDIEADAVIVGSGPGGATAAMVLARAGLDVAVLEAGLHVPADQMSQREKEMMGRLYQMGGTRQTEDGGVTILHGEVLGGGSVVNHLICFEPPDRLLELWAAEGIEDLTPAAMRPRFDEIRRILNVAPTTPDQLNRNNDLLRIGGERMGWRGHCFERNAFQCLGSGFCTLGCAYNAKQSAALTMLPLASQSGARVYTGCEVRRIVHNGRYAELVEGVIREDGRRPGGRRLRVRAEHVLVAGGAIQTPALLLRSHLPDPSGQIGRNLYLHPGSPVIAHFPGQDVNPFEGILQGYHISEFSWGLSGHPLDVLPEGIGGAPGVASLVVPGLGEEHLGWMGRVREAAIAGVLLRDHHSGRVEIDAGGRPHVHYTLHPEDADRMRAGSKRTMEAYFAAGAARCMTGHARPCLVERAADVDHLDGYGYAPGEITLISYHQMGTARMGGDRGRHVVNPDGRLWAMDNVYVCDSSVFPTASGVNPQITVYGMAMRIAERLVRKLGK